MTNWYKEAYKKNTKQHLHGGKREKFGSQSLTDAAYDEEDEYVDGEVEMGREDEDMDFTADLNE